MTLFRTPLVAMGLMSGTSVDSIDAACIQVTLNPDPLRLTQCDVLGTLTHEIPSPLRKVLLSVMAGGALSLETYGTLHHAMGQCFAEAAQALQQQVQVAGHTVDLIASHGQTLYHQPPQNGQNGWTLQIGDPAGIAAQTGCPVVADFRSADMAYGGQGAPLVPFADFLLFQSDTQGRIIQNIGGIANLTYVPPSPCPDSLIAFDTGPGNMILDAWMTALYGKPYDADGAMAAEGAVIPALLAEMLSDPYFEEPPPKSTGRERFGEAMAMRWLSQWRDKAQPVDLMATATALTVQTIVAAYQRFVLPQGPIHEVIVGGGGVYNRTLMQGLQAACAPLGWGVKRHEDMGLSSKYKEAVAFALLGTARWQGIPGNVPSCTGASAACVLGALWLPGRTPNL